ncbi:MAG: hypothetical protein JWN43_1718 [Gammaproteobacteria bacterium]|nr:hypothetical protein [Gammaproteobacteria bacterium]
MKVAALALACCGAAHQGAGAESLQPEQDGAFLVRAVEMSREEVVDARTASHTSRSTEVQRTARSIADGHQRAIRELAGLAQRKGVDVPKGTAGVGRIGSDADPDRIAGFVKAHEAAVALFHQEAVRGMDPDLRKFAQTTLPVLQRRLIALHSLQEVYPPGMESESTAG